MDYLSMNINKIYSIYDESRIAIFHPASNVFVWAFAHINPVKGAKMKKFLGSLVALLAMVALPVFAAVNINTATQSELEAVKGLGPAKAKAIIAYREQNGAFKSVDDLDKVKGFGKATVDKLREELSVGAEKPKQ